MRKLRAVDYVRVSHKDLERGISVQIQQDVNAREIAAQGWQHVGTYTDDGTRMEYALHHKGILLDENL